MFQRPLAVTTLALLCGTAFAQVPYGYLVTAESGAAPDGFRIINPATGHVTEMTEGMANFLGSAKSIAIDKAALNSVVTSAGGSFGGAPVWHLPLTNNFYDFLTMTGRNLPMFGAFSRIHTTPSEILFTLSSVSDGLYSMTNITATPVLLTSLTRAADIAVVNGKAYVNSFLSAQPSTIVEFDLTTRTARTLGTSYPAIRSLGTVSGLLVAGREDGDVNFIDPITGTATPLLPTGLGSILAIVEDGQGTTYLAANNSIYEFTNLATPIHVSPYTLEDIDVGSVDQATQLIYGNGCASLSPIPVATSTPPPALGSNYTMSLTGAEANAPGAAVLGFNRANLDLGNFGYPGCTSLVANVTAVLTPVDTNGNTNTMMPIPSSSAFVGINVNAQFFVIGPSNTLTSSAGIEGQIR